MACANTRAPGRATGPGFGASINKRGAMRHRKTDAHIATIRVSIPIAAMDAASVQAAADAIAEIQNELPPGSVVEVLNSRFGRVEAPTPAPQTAPVTPAAVADVMGEIKTIMQQPGNEPEIPAALKRSA